MAKTVREVIAALEQAGWVQVRQRGSHRQFRHPARNARITVAGNRNRNVPAPTPILSKIRRGSGLEELR